MLKSGGLSRSLLPSCSDIVKIHVKNSETTVCSVVTCSARWGSVTKVFSHTSQLVKKTNGRETVCAKAPEEFGEVTLEDDDEQYHAQSSMLCKS